MTESETQSQSYLAIWVAGIIFGSAGFAVAFTSKLTAGQTPAELPIVAMIILVLATAQLFRGYNGV